MTSNNKSSLNAFEFMMTNRHKQNEIIKNLKENEENLKNLKENDDNDCDAYEANKDKSSRESLVSNIDMKGNCFHSSLSDKKLNAFQYLMFSRIKTASLDDINTEKDTDINLGLKDSNADLVSNDTVANSANMDGYITEDFSTPFSGAKLEKAEKAIPLQTIEDTKNPQINSDLNLNLTDEKYFDIEETFKEEIRECVSKVKKKGKHKGKKQKANKTKTGVNNNIQIDDTNPDKSLKKNYIKKQISEVLTSDKLIPKSLAENDPNLKVSSPIQKGIMSFFQSTNKCQSRDSSKAMPDKDFHDNNDNLLKDKSIKEPIVETKADLDELYSTLCVVQKTTTSDLRSFRKTKSISENTNDSTNNVTECNGNKLDFTNTIQIANESDNLKSNDSLLQDKEVKLEDTKKDELKEPVILEGNITYTVSSDSLASVSCLEVKKSDIQSENKKDKKIIKSVNEKNKLKQSAVIKKDEIKEPVILDENSIDIVNSDSLESDSPLEVKKSDSKLENKKVKKKIKNNEKTKLKKMATDDASPVRLRRSSRLPKTPNFFNIFADSNKENHSSNSEDNNDAPLGSDKKVNKLLRKSKRSNLKPKKELNNANKKKKSTSNNSRIASDSDSDIEVVAMEKSNVASPCRDPSKVAPIFKKTSSVAIVISPTKLKARTDFLFSDVPDTLKKLAAKTNEEVVAPCPLPSVSHVVQKCDSRLWDLPEPSMSILNRSPHNMLDNDFTAHKKLPLTYSKLPPRLCSVKPFPFLDMPTMCHILAYLKQKYPEFPIISIFKAYLQSKEEFFHIYKLNPKCSELGKRYLKDLPIKKTASKTSILKSKKIRKRQSIELNSSVDDFSIPKPKLRTSKKKRRPLQIVTDESSNDVCILSEESRNACSKNPLDDSPVFKSTILANKCCKRKNNLTSSHRKRRKLEAGESTEEIDISEEPQDEIPVWHRWSPFDWNVVFAPKSPELVIGNSGPVRELKQWLASWKSFAMASNAKNAQPCDSDTSRCSSLGDEGILKAALISGPPGVGKTAMVQAVASHLAYKVLEVNASSLRSGKQLLSQLSEATQSHTLKSASQSLPFVQACGQETSATSSQGSEANDDEKLMSLILVEDLDIVFDEDDGFWSAVNNLLCASKRPLALTTSLANPRRLEAKLKQEVFHIALEPQKPHVIATHLHLLCLANGVFACSNELELLVRKNQSDVRRSVADLQFWILSGSFGSQIHWWKVENAKNLRHAVKATDSADINILSVLPAACQVTSKSVQIPIASGCLWSKAHVKALKAPFSEGPAAVTGLDWRLVSANTKTLLPFEKNVIKTSFVYPLSEQSEIFNKSKVKMKSKFLSLYSDSEDETDSDINVDGDKKFTDASTETKKEKSVSRSPQFDAANSECLSSLRNYFKYLSHLDILSKCDDDDLLFEQTQSDNWWRSNVHFGLESSETKLSSVPLTTSSLCAVVSTLSDANVLKARRQMAKAESGLLEAKNSDAEALLRIDVAQEKDSLLVHLHNTAAKSVSSEWHSTNATICSRLPLCAHFSHNAHALDYLPMVREMARSEQIARALNNQSRRASSRAAKHLKFSAGFHDISDRVWLKMCNVFHKQFH